jgi:hypothetical protein
MLRVANTFVFVVVTSLFLFANMPKGMADSLEKMQSLEPDCDWVAPGGYKPSQKDRENVKKLVTMVIFRALNNRLPWKGDVVPSVKKCSVSTFTYTLMMTDFAGDSLVFNMKKRILASMRSGEYYHLLCYDDLLNKVYRPTGKYCF